MASATPTFLVPLAVFFIGFVARPAEAKKVKKRAPVAAPAPPRDEDPRLVAFLGDAGLAVLRDFASMELVLLADGPPGNGPSVGGRTIAGKPVALPPAGSDALRRRLLALRSWHFPPVAIEEGAIPMEEEKLCTAAPQAALRVLPRDKKADPLELTFDLRCNEAERVPSATEAKLVRKTQSVFVRRVLDLGQEHGAWLATFRAAFPDAASLKGFEPRDELARVLGRARRIDELYAFDVLRAPVDRVAYERWMAVGKQRQAGDWYEMLGEKREVTPEVRTAAEGLLLDDAFWQAPPADPPCDSPAAYALRFDAGPKRGRGEAIDLLFSAECQRVDLSIVRTLHDAWRDVRHVATTRFTEKAIWRLLAEAFPDAVEFDAAAFEKPSAEATPSEGSASPAPAPKASSPALELDL